LVNFALVAKIWYTTELPASTTTSTSAADADRAVRIAAAATDGGSATEKVATVLLLMISATPVATPTKVSTGHSPVGEKADGNFCYYEEPLLQIWIGWII
jgi:hypothetical protein